MKKLLSALLACMLVLGMASAENEKPRNPVIPGESPVTGLPLAEDRYMPMLIEVGHACDTVKVGNKKIKAAGVGKRAPWGAQHADMVYESILWGSGETRMTFLLNDCFANQGEMNVGPVRSVRMGAALLCQEWQGGLVFTGGANREGYDLYGTLSQMGAWDRGLVFSLHKNAKAREHMYRVKDIKAPDNLNADVRALRASIPAETVAVPHPFLFFDQNPYASGYEMGELVELKWGKPQYDCSFVYDEASGLYQRYCGKAPYMSFESAENRAPEAQIPLRFSNVIVQYVRYEYALANNLLPLMQCVGGGSADCYIGGRLIKGSWERKAAEEPTVFLDDKGNEIQLARGKTYIAQFPQP
ncbi:MAG: DUF3048 C-terminal domain-containing protein [Clostridia bacterium]